MNINNSDFVAFKYGDDQRLLLKTPDGVFRPTGTTTALVKAVTNYINKPGKLLDLGCGNGVAGIALHQMGIVHEPLYASDLSEEAVEIAKLNSEIYNCKIIAKSGSIFEPWKNEKFDYIINDISGVAAQVARISPWFESVPCESGEDGTELVVRMLETANNHLNANGRLFFPVISLSKTKKIINAAKKQFSTVEQISRDEWPLPKEIATHKELLSRLSENKLIQFAEKFGMLTYFTDIYVAY